MIDKPNIPEKAHGWASGYGVTLVDPGHSTDAIHSCLQRMATSLGGVRPGEVCDQCIR